MKRFLFHALMALALASVSFASFAQNFGYANPLYFDSNVTYNPNGLSSNPGSPKSLIDVGDIDADGDMDIVRSPQDYAATNMDFFINDGSNNFTSINAINYGLDLVTSIGFADFYMCPSLGDLDGDLDLDMVMVGSTGSTLYYFENTGTPSSPSFASPVVAPFGISTPAISSIQLIDLSGDGLLDIVGGSSEYGFHYWVYYENTGSVNTPAFASPLFNPFGLQVASSTDYYPGDAVYLNFYDYDSDGDYDLTYSNLDYVYYQENMGNSTNPAFISLNFQFNWVGQGNYQYFQWDADAEIEMIGTSNMGDFAIFNDPEISISQQPVDVTLCDGQYTSIYVSASNVMTYYWQVYYPGTGWVAAPNDWYHSGQGSYAFYFSPATSTDNNTSYRCILSDMLGNQVISDSVHITVTPYQYWYQDLDGDGLGNYSTAIYSCQAPGSNYVTNSSDCDDTNPVVIPVPGDPTVFPTGEWNIYGFDGTNLEAYRGYYTRQGLTFNSAGDYDSFASPSSATGWQGCTVSNDYFSISAKRHGFVNNGLAYAIRIDSWDETVYVYVNGVYVAGAGCCGVNLVAWTGMLDETSDVEIRSLDYSGSQNLAFTIYEVTPLYLSYSGSSNASAVSCGQLAVSLYPTSNLGYSSQDITYTVTVDDPSIVNPIITYVDNWWSTTTIYFNMAGTVGTTTLHLVGTDPAGNSDTLDYVVTSTPCPPTLISNYVNTYCGATTDTTTFMVFDTPVANTYTVQDLYSDNPNAILNSDLQIVSTLPIDSTFSNGITYHGTAFVVQFTYSGPDTWAYIYLTIQSSDGSTYQMSSAVQRIIDYTSPTIFADFSTINLEANAETCTAQADWTVASSLPQSYFGTGSDYITNFTGSGIFYVAANSPMGVTRFGLNGNAGADGNGHVDYGSQTYIAPSGRSYILFYEMAQEYSGDPGINNILIVEGSETGAYLNYDSWLSNATAVIEGLSGSGKVMFAATIGSTPVGWNGGSTSVYSSATMIAVGERFADAIDATRTAAAGNPMDLSLIDASMQVETAYMTSVMLTDFYALNPIPYDIIMNLAGQIIGISDGGYDMYDGGNYIVTNYNDYYTNGNSGIPYTNGVVTAGGPASNSAASTIAVVDDCPFSLTFSHASGSQFPVGTTQVLVTAADSSGHVVTFTFDVVVTGTTQSYYVDADLDGFGTGSLVQLCQIPTSGYSLDNTDCDDADAAVHPNATEVCNSVDDDCDGLADDGLTFTNYYLDTDADGFGAGAPFNLCANPGSAYALTNTDCNNTNANAHPGASEVCGNNVDEDCNGIADNGCFVSGIGENPSNAVSCTTSLWPNCSSISGTLVGAASSSAAQTLCL